MTKTTLALLSLLCAATLSAQTADLSMRLIVERPDIAGLSTTYRAGQEVFYDVAIRNFGPSTAKNVVVDIDFVGEYLNSSLTSNEFTCTKTKPVRCVAAELSPANFERQIGIWTIGPSAPGEYTAFAAMRSDTPDPNPSNNQPVSQAYSVIALPDLKVSASTLATRIQPNDTQTTTVSVSNLTPATPAHDVRVLFTPVNGATVTAIDLLAGPPGSQCVASGNSAQCSIPELARGSVFAHPEVMTARVTLRAPQRSDGGKIGLRISASSAENDFDLTDNTAEVTTSLVRQLVVSHTGDSGLGSLRQAILDSQTQCATDPCRINFEIRLATPKNGWFTIHPFTPLPPVSGVVEINASSQVAISGAPVANGPAIELRGDLQREGDGLTVLGGCEVTITGLAINSFPVHAISAGGLPPRACTLVLPTGGPLTISRNFIGLDPTGSAVLPNYRGIWIGNVGGVRISDNFIGGNVRSAIFLADKFTSSSVNGNRIGVTIDGKPAPNGATGIYIHGEGTISDNVIANGGEFGIAVDPAPTSHVGIHRNLIYDNQHTAIDQGLDLETPNRKDAGGTFANKPILIDAVYQPENGTTVIRGRLDSDPASTIGPQYVLEFFAAKSLSKGGHAQAERYLGSLTPKSGHEDFEFTAKGDLRGQLIAATSSRSFYNGFGIPDGGGTTAEFLINPEDTSELSDPVQVR